MRFEIMRDEMRTDGMRYELKKIAGFDRFFTVDEDERVER